MEKEFKKRSDVLNFLQEKGYKVSKSSFYENHAKKITMKDGVYSEKQIMNYAIAHLKTKSGHKSMKVQEAVNKRENLKTEREEVDLQLAQIKLLREQRKSINSDRVYTMFVSVLEGLYTTIGGQYDTEAAEIIEIAEGKQEKIKEVVGALHDLLDRAFNNFARIRIIKTVFEDES